MSKPKPKMDSLEPKDTVSMDSNKSNFGFGLDNAKKWTFKGKKALPQAEPKVNKVL